MKDSFVLSLSKDALAPGVRAWFDKLTTNGAFICLWRARRPLATMQRVRSGEQVFRPVSTLERVRSGEQV